MPTVTARLAIIPLALCGLTSLIGGNSQEAVKTESFDRDPGWEGINNRSAVPPREIRQDFGYSGTNHAGGEVGELGGLITPAAEPAFYAKRIPTRTFETPLEASGLFNGTAGAFNIFIGFFNHQTVNEWRTPNTLGIRLYGRGDVFYAYVEYCTSKWRAGADSPGGFAEIRNAETGRVRLRGFKVGAPHRWTLKYDPKGHQGHGSFTATMDGESAVCHLGVGHKSDGAKFTRFGLLNIVKSADGGGEVWLDDLVVNGSSEKFDRNPRWHGHQNRSRILSKGVRPRFDFGYSPTAFAGGRRGELGGHVYRGDERSADTMASYADRIGPLDLARPIRASGRVALRRGVSDSTTLFGFFNAQESMRIRTDGRETMIPSGFLGFAIEGPSSEGFFMYPTSNIGGHRQYAGGQDRPRIYPNGKSERWTLDYEPRSRKLRVSLGRQSSELTLDPNAGVAAFDRIGIITTTVDGNSQHVYFDDLTYTAR